MLNANSHAPKVKTNYVELLKTSDLVLESMLIKEDLIIYSREYGAYSCAPWRAGAPLLSKLAYMYAK